MKAKYNGIKNCDICNHTKPVVHVGGWIGNSYMGMNVCRDSFDQALVEKNYIKKCGWCSTQFETYDVDMHHCDNCRKNNDWY